MPLQIEELEKILRDGEITAIQKFFKGATEGERNAVARVTLQWCRRLTENWRAQFNKKADAEVKIAGPIGNWDFLMPAANAAALATASFSEIKSLEHLSRTPPEAMVAILTDRRPVWLDDYAEFLCQHELRGWGGNWKHTRALVRAGLCRPPKHENYVLEAINGIWPRIDRTKPQPELVDLLLKERDWLESDFWRLFELDGNGEVSLANSEKYNQSKSTWADAMVELSRRQILSRDKLLDASLSALSRDFIQFRAGWFSRIHEALEPTPTERTARLDAYLRLLASSIPPTVAFAVDAVGIMDKASSLPAATLASSLQPVLNAKGKAVVKTALKLLESAARREPDAREMICIAAVPALLHESAEVQKAVFDLIDAHGVKSDPELQTKLSEASDAVAASLKPRLAAWLGASVKPTIASNATASKAPNAKFSRIEGDRAIEPIQTLDDLIDRAGAILEEAADPNEIERMLDGVSRLCDQRPEDFERRTQPLRKRALKKREQGYGGSFRPSLERALAMFLLTWIDGTDGFTERPENLAHGQNHFAFLLRRLMTVGRRVQTRQAMPLLSAPTHRGGWIEPCALVKRWIAWEKARLKPELNEQVLALLRLTPEGRDKALKLALDLKDEPGRALRFALGEKHAVGDSAPLWLAALRSRQPHGDLPEFEKKHPCLGPDAGVGAQYVWSAEAKRSQGQKLSWTHLEFHLRFEPPCPEQIDDSLLPVLFFGPWMGHEEGHKYFMRWTSHLWPANQEATFARACKRLEASVDYADANDREFSAYLEPLAEPYTELGPMACVALALGLAAQDPALRGHAQDGLIAAISEGRMNLNELGGAMSRLLDSGSNKFARWAKALREVSRISPVHASTTVDLISRMLHGDPDTAPRDVSTLLELLFELLNETGGRVTDQPARNYLSALKTGGKTAKLARQILALK